MFDNPFFIEELREMLRRSRYDLRNMNPLDTDDLVKDIMRFIEEQLEIERRRR
jgi:hypothetical protein